jgi:DNA mismatch repair protein MSH6
LEILENQRGEKEGSLLNFLDYCSTPFGKRLLRRWIVAPLMDVSQINRRLDAIEDLIKVKKEAD